MSRSRIGEERGGGCNSRPVPMWGRAASTMLSGNHWFDVQP